MYFSIWMMIHVFFIGFFSNFVPSTRNGHNRYAFEVCVCVFGVFGYIVRT